MFNEPVTRGLCISIYLFIFYKYQFISF
jgi:hypothetical protein